MEPKSMGQIAYVSRRGTTEAMVVGLLILWALLVMLVPGCSKQVSPPKTDEAKPYLSLVKTFTAAGCAFMPADEQDAAREILPTVLDLARRDPAGAYELLTRNPDKARAFGYLWAGLHGVIDLLATTPAEWVRFVEDSIAPSVEGCLAALGATT